jgi:hypothetical protein
VEVVKAKVQLVMAKGQHGRSWWQNRVKTPQPLPHQCRDVLAILRDFSELATAVHHALAHTHHSSTAIVRLLCIVRRDPRH